jgi:hypothetical protein
VTSSFGYTLSAILNSRQHSEWTKLPSSGIDQERQGRQRGCSRDRLQLTPTQRRGEISFRGRQTSLILGFFVGSLSPGRIGDRSERAEGLQEQAHAAGSERASLCFLQMKRVVDLLPGYRLRDSRALRCPSPRGVARIACRMIQESDSARVIRRCTCSAGLWIKNKSRDRCPT